MSGRDYVRYLNMLLVCFKEMNEGHGYCFDDENFHRLHKRIEEEVIRIAGILKIKNRDKLKQLVYTDEIQFYAERILKINAME